MSACHADGGPGEVSCYGGSGAASVFAAGPSVVCIAKREPGRASESHGPGVARAGQLGRVEWLDEVIRRERECS
jgi:hypothetical protein